MAAASSSSSAHIKRYHVFPSFHGPDVRRRFLSHLHNLFERKGIITFKDQEIERGHTIGPELVQAIRESRVSIVLLSKNYASSSWCLDELVEILKCREDHGQLVMTIFYDVDPSDVRKQRGDFGSAFMKTCQGKTEEVKQKWSKALAYVATIAGEHSLNWTDEAAMVEKFAKDVSNKLNVTLSRDFDGMVGLQTHLRKLSTLLCFECDDVKMIGIWGPAGIGKSTIARALFNQLSSDFLLRCFMGNLKGSYKSIMGVDDYDSKLCLQNQLLSRIFNQRDMRVHHLGAIKEWLKDQRVLIILDDVDDRAKLEVLVKVPSWFGPGSRIIVTTEDKKILKEHEIDVIYNVDFPSKKEARKILCLYAFKETTVRDGFEELVNRVAKFCGNLPLGLAVVGSSLRGESKQEWELQLSRIETSLDRKMEDVLRVGYDRLLKKDQVLFLHIACFFNEWRLSHVTNMLADSNLDVRNGLKTLTDKSLVRVTSNGLIARHSRLQNWLNTLTDKSLVYISAPRQIVVMHSLLQNLGRQIVLEQSDEPGKRQFLVEPEEIRDVLVNETGTGSLIGIKFNATEIGKICISKRAFEGMRNLQLLEIHHYGRSVEINFLDIQEDLEYLPRLRLLDWRSYPSKSLPPKFQPSCLVKLHLPFSKLEKLWDGIQPLANLKKINLAFSYRLKEIPNLSNATNLETLSLMSCSSLVELPSSIGNLHKLKRLYMVECENLRVIPININLASLEEVNMTGCSKLGIFPDISSNIKTLITRDTKIKEVPASVGRWSRCELLDISSKSLERLTHLPLSVALIDVTKSGIKRIPPCIISLHHLVYLYIENCTKLMSIPALPPSLKSLNASNCVSLKTVWCSPHNPIKKLTLYNCLKLDEEARRGILLQSVYNYICLPGKEIPAEFTHKATGKSITIPLPPGGEGTFSASSRFKACVLLSPIDHAGLIIRCRLRSKGGVEIDKFSSSVFRNDLSVPEHLFIFSGDLNRYHEVDVATSEITFEFSCLSKDDNITECGVQILTEEAVGSSNRKVDYFDTESSSSKVEYYETGGNGNDHTDGDENYEAEAFIVSQGENTQRTRTTPRQGSPRRKRVRTCGHKDTSGWSWLEKLGLKKKKN